jgi:hypothetical protein
MDFTLLHRSSADGSDGASAALEEPVVVSLALTGESVGEFLMDLSLAARKRRLIFNSDVFTPEEAGFAAVADALGESIPVSMLVDYRQIFATEFKAGSHFGNCTGTVDFELPADGPEAGGLLRRRSRTLHSREFWAWKLSQPKSHALARLVIESWIESFNLELLQFGSITPYAVGVCGTYWRDWTKTQGTLGIGRMMFLPQADGGFQMTALLPRDAAVKFDRRYHCSMWHPDVP